MKLTILLLVLLVFISSCRGVQSDDSEAYLSRFLADLWLEGSDVIKVIWRDCSKKLVDVKEVIDHKKYFPKFVRCMKRKSLRALDESLSSDVVPVADGVNLVRFELVDGSGNTMPINSTSTWTDKELDEGNWRSLSLQRIAKVLRTHVLKFDFEDSKIIDKVEYRGRRRHHMMTMMMFGIVSIGMVLIPMGFQFLAVLGGKALLLAKMALILTSIQGLKKIASSPLNYGFYHSYPYEHYEKRSINYWPQPAIVPPTLPPTMTIHNLWQDAETINSKLDKKEVEENKENLKITKSTIDVITWKPKISKPPKKPVPKIFPVYLGPSSSAVDASNSPTVENLTTIPGEVQADYTLDLPYHRFRFQSPTTVIPS